jgi:hypothetical protein
LERIAVFQRGFGVRVMFAQPSDDRDAPLDLP